MDDRQFSRELDDLQEYEKYYFEFRTNQLLDKYGRNSRLAQKEALQETIDLREIALPISKEKRTWHEVYAQKLDMLGERDRSRSLLEEKEKSKLNAMDIASAGLAVYGGPTGIVLDVGKEMVGGDSSIKKVGKAAVEKVKEVKMSLEDYFTSKQGPMGKLEVAYIKEQEEKDNKRSSRFLKKKNEWINSLKRKQENLKKQVMQLEKKIAEANNRNRTAKMENERNALVKAMSKNNESLKMQLSEKDAFVKNKKNLDRINKEREKHHQQFNAMSDREKVEFAIALDKKGKPSGKEFLEAVNKNGEEMNMTLESLEITQQYLGRPRSSVKAFARDMAAANKMARDNNLRSTIENAEINDLLEKSSSGDIRESFAVRDESRSMRSTKHYLREKTGRQDIGREDDMELSRNR